MALPALLQPPADFPNYLVRPAPVRFVLPRAGWLLLGLFLLCLAPRAYLCYKARYLCPDATLYVQLAQAIEQGDTAGGLREMRLNTFPLVLAALHRAGLSWEVGGMAWGVLVSSLAVLPLFGWIRRQFNDRVAAVGSMLYAVNTTFIENTPDVIRDPTFWFLFVLTIYLMWRAVTELRIWLFAAAGLATALAVATRMEGLLLAIPLVLWAFWRYRALADRRPLLTGMVVFLATPPLLVLLVNITWLRHHPQWEWFRLPPAAMGLAWLEKLGPRLGGLLDQSGPLAQNGAESLPFKRLVYLFFNTWERGLTPLFGLALFTGMFGWRRTWARRDHQPMFYVGGALAIGIWVFICYSGERSERYPLPAVPLGCGFAALGLLWVCGGAAKLAARLRVSQVWQPRLAVVPLVLVAAVSLVDALTKDYGLRHFEARLGFWVRDHYPAPRCVVGHRGTANIVSHYAEASCIWFNERTTPAQIVEQAAARHPNVVVVVKTYLRDAEGAMPPALAPLGLSPVPRRALPPNGDHVVVLAREAGGTATATRPAATLR